MKVLLIFAAMLLSQVPAQSQAPPGGISVAILPIDSTVNEGFLRKLRNVESQDRLQDLLKGTKWTFVVSKNRAYILEREIEERTKVKLFKEFLSVVRSSMKSGQPIKLNALKPELQKHLTNAISSNMLAASSVSDQIAKNSLTFGLVGNYQFELTDGKRTHKHIMTVDRSNLNEFAEASETPQEAMAHTSASLPDSAEPESEETKFFFSRALDHRGKQRVVSEYLSMYLAKIDSIREELRDLMIEFSKSTYGENPDNVGPQTPFETLPSEVKDNIIRNADKPWYGFKSKEEMDSFFSKAKVSGGRYSINALFGKNRSFASVPIDTLFWP